MHSCLAFLALPLPGSQGTAPLALARLHMTVTPALTCPAVCPQNKKKMSLDDFARINRSTNEGEPMPRELLEGIYASISRDELKISSGEVGQGAESLSCVSQLSSRWLVMVLPVALHALHASHHVPCICRKHPSHLKQSTHSSLPFALQNPLPTSCPACFGSSWLWRPAARAASGWQAAAVSTPCLSACLPACRLFASLQPCACSSVPAA